MALTEPQFVREAAKIRLLTPDHKLVFVEGPSGRANLLGGGKEPGQTIRETLLGEAHQEAGVEEQDIIDLSTGETISGPIKDGEALWHMHDGRLVDDHRPLKAGAEVQRIRLMTPGEAIRYSGLMSDLARTAVHNRFFL
jgi:hypothetical protein